MNTIAGKTSHTENSEQISYSPSQGWTNLRGIEGPKEAVRALLDQLAVLGYSFTYNSDQSPKASVQFQTIGVPGPGQAETPTLQWEYFANGQEIDVLETDITAISGISVPDRELIRVAINNNDKTQAADLTGNALALYQLMVGGVRSFRINLPTLRVSKLVSGSYGVKASLTNVGRILSTAKLTLDEAIPGTILFDLPSYTSAKTGFFYAWYKKHPTVQQAGGNKWNISQEWEYGLWPVFLYGSVL